MPSFESTGRAVIKYSNNAADALLDLVAEGYEDDDAMCETDCTHGCIVEPDGLCPHGFMSAARTAGIL